MRFRPSSRWLETAHDYLIAPSTVLIMTAATLGLRTVLQPAAYFPFVLPVAVSGWLGGFGPGLAATVLSLVMIEAFFLPSSTSILTGDLHDLGRIGLFLVVGALVSWINHAMRHARRAAEDGHRRYRQLAEALPQVVFVTRPDGSVAWCNQWWFDLTGLPAVEIDVTGGWQRAIHPDDLARLTELHGATPLEPHTYEYRVRRAADGEYRWHLGRSMPMIAPDGRFEGRIGVAADIHEQKRTETLLRDQADDLRASEQRFRTMADTVPQLVWTADAHGVTLWHNQRWAEYLGRPLHSVARLSRGEWEHLVHDDDAPTVAERWRESVQTGQRFEAEYRIRRASDGAWRWHLARATATRDAAGNVRQWVGTCTDIHDQKRAEELIRDQMTLLEQRVDERTAELRQSHAQMADYAHTIAHDLRAPLRAMRGYIDVLFEEHAAGLDPHGREYGARIARAAERMNALLEDLQTYNQVGRVAMSHAPFGVRRAVESAATQLEAEIASRGAVVTLDVPEAAVAVGHEPSYVQAVANLIANGIKFVSPGVRPALRVWTEPRNDGQVRLWVQDNGIGIAREHQDKVFRIFERIPAAAGYPGTGIGLAIVLRALERMGGRCGVESEPGHGSRFWLELEHSCPAAVRSADGIEAHAAATAG